MPGAHRPIVRIRREGSEDLVIERIGGAPGEERRGTRYGQIAETADANGDGRDDYIASVGERIDGRFESECGNWGECVSGVYVSCAP